MVSETLVWAVVAIAVLASQSYTIVNRFLRLLLHMYFRRIDVYGINNLPREGPVILSPNHPNMMVDPIMVITECSRHGRDPYVWAKGSLFANPIASFLLKKLGAVPVYRPRKATDTLMDVDSNKTSEQIADANKKMFEHTWRTLAEGNVMVLFPEGTSYTAPKMLSLRTGVMRVATGFVQHYNQPIPIIPVGLNYFNKEHFRSQMSLEFGTPMVITPEHVQSEAFKQDEFGEIKRLTLMLEEKMHALTLNASDFNTIRIARVMRRLFLNTPGSIDANKELQLTQQIINLLESEPKDEATRAKIDDLRTKVQQYKDRLDRLRLKDQDIVLPAIEKHSLVHIFTERILFLLVLLPLATPGLLLNLPYYFVGTKMNSLAGFVESQSMYKIFAAGILVPVQWLVLILATWYFFGSSYAYTMALALPVLLYSHIRVIEESRPLLEHFYFVFSIATHADQVSTVTKEREQLVPQIYDLILDNVDPVVLAKVRQTLTSPPKRAAQFRRRRSLSTSDSLLS